MKCDLKFTRRRGPDLAGRLGGGCGVCGGEPDVDDRLHNRLTAHGPVVAGGKDRSGGVRSARRQLDDSRDEVLVPKKDALGREVTAINLQTKPNSARTWDLRGRSACQGFECVTGVCGAERKDPRPQAGGCGWWRGQGTHRLPDADGLVAGACCEGGIRKRANGADILLVAVQLAAQLPGVGHLARRSALSEGVRKVNRWFVVCR